MEDFLGKLFLDTPLYTKININEQENDIIYDILYDIGVKEFEGYNPFNQIESTFTILDLKLKYDYKRNLYKNGGHFGVNVKCKRLETLFVFYLFWNPLDNELIKVGQYPSVADFHISEIKQYAKILPNDKMKEITRAMGLAANGVGIGSFVYLRRVFEHLINEAFDKANEKGLIDEGNFQRSRMDEKIQMLSEYLPNFLVDNKSIYSILSKGIHELDEQSCLAYFDSLRAGIEIILDEKLDNFKKQSKIESAKKKLDELHSKIKKPSTQK